LGKRLNLALEGDFQKDWPKLKIKLRETLHEDDVDLIEIWFAYMIKKKNGNWKSVYISNILNMQANYFSSRDFIEFRDNYQYCE
jgi:hypothetical protein